MPQMQNRVQETTTTGGTGTLTLAGAVTGYITFASGFSTGTSLFYTIDNGIGEWEIGIGTLVTTGTLSRVTVIASSNGGALVNFGSGTKRVFCSAPTRSLVPDQDSKSGYVLTTDGTDPAWTQTLNGITIGNLTAAGGAFTTLSASSTVSGSGFSTYLASPPAIGGTTPAAGAFTTLSASSTVSGTGFSTYLASPPAIGGTAAAAGAFTTLSASSTVSGTGFSTYLASPPAIGGTAAAAGAFTTLSASSTVSGTGFSTYLASPPAIGGTTPAAGNFTTLSASSTVSGTGFSTYLASPPAIGGTAAAAGAFTTLSASSTVSGTGFSTYLASPPAIGGTTPAAGNFTNLSYTGTLTGGTGVIAIGTNQIYKDASGNVGIGTSSPGSKLVVQGSCRLTESGQFLVSGPVQSGNTYYGWEIYNVNSTVNYLQSFNRFAGAYMNSVYNALSHQFLIEGAERMRIDSSGNVGIGTSSPIGKTHIYTTGAAATVSQSFSGLNIENTPGDPMLILTGLDGGGGIIASMTSAQAATPMRFYTGQTERMRIDASGSLLVGGTSQLFSSKFSVYGSIAAQSTFGPMFVSNENNNDNVGRSSFNFNRNGTTVGQIVTTNSTCLFNSTSDVRLKTNITPAGSAIQSILDFPVDQFDWILSGEHQDFGGIAQKIIPIIPEMVSVPEDPEGMMGVDWSKAVPRLIRAYQELHQEIETLKQRIH